MKPTGCLCPGEEHVNILCFVTRPPKKTVGDRLRELGKAVSDDGIRESLTQLKQDQFVLETLAGPAVMELWKSGQINAGEMIHLVRQQVKKDLETNETIVVGSSC